MTLTDWIAANPEYLTLALLALVYLARSAMPRLPNPTWPAWALTLWEIEARVLALPWDRWLGRPKLPGLLSPPYSPFPDEAPTKKEGQR